MIARARVAIGHDLGACAEIAIVEVIATTALERRCRGDRRDSRHLLAQSKPKLTLTEVAMTTIKDAEIMHFPWKDANTAS